MITPDVWFWAERFVEANSVSPERGIGATI
jgi:hypothetical protein